MCIINNKKCKFCNRKLPNFKNEEDKRLKREHSVHNKCYKEIQEKLEQNHSLYGYAVENQDDSNVKLFEFIQKENTKLHSYLQCF